ncbi:hypothetical protein NOR_06261 [Metarhizium rileyi]|uniref:Carbohydrate-binding module family 96 domain-containing protein n=1 Tax=Metarhizium rileyi (strain RCEF 4871) TaxID=1649241 RepID=A0A167AXD9_METRR|nr:hypothetical protein NOR_06261 [Metarhizium rileyi RCEF 4871]TWU79217.1 hypothetical protein ED733_008977 [Metarhizium rileyi]
MQLIGLLSSSLFLASIAASQTRETLVSAIKDSTILRSTVSCPNCPERNCYKCTLGHERTLQAKSGGLSYIRMLIGFELPSSLTTFRQCTLQVAEFTGPREYPVNVTVAQALTSDWDESTVTGESAPGSHEPFTTAAVPSHTNIGPIDITKACRDAGSNGQFSVYVGTRSDSIEIWSKDSGRPAILRINYT